MTIDSLRRTLALVRTDGRLTSYDVKKLAAAAKEDGSIDAAELAELKSVSTRYASSFTSFGKREMEALIASVVVAPPAVPTTPSTPSTTPTTPVTPPTTPVAGQPEKVVIEAKNKPWTSTYWPMAGKGTNADGTPTSNLWAKGGPLDKIDQVLRARGLPTGARDFELKPNLNWLVGKEGGYYVPNSTVSEKDAEKTTGVDFNGNGKIEADIAWDFLDSRGQFGKDGKMEGTMSVGWWGSCDLVAGAGVMFKTPEKDVTIDGVTFTPLDIMGLLAVLSTSQGGGADFVGERYDNQPDVITLMSGERIKGVITGSIDLFGEGVRRQGDTATVTKFTGDLTVKLMDGTEKTLTAREIASVTREDKLGDAGVFHKTIIDWLSDGRPAVMDRDNGEHVWNYAFWKTEDSLYKDGLKPSWAPAELNGINGPAGDGTITYVERKVSLGTSSGGESYKYWIEEKNGQIVNSGWGPGSDTPDFLWRPKNEPTFTGANERNPFVTAELVKSIYEEATA